MGTREEYVYRVGAILRRGEDGEQVVEDIAGDLLVRALTGHPVPPGVLDGAVRRIYFRKYRGLGTVGLGDARRDQDGGEGDGQEESLREPVDEESDPALLILQKEDLEEARRIWEKAREELSPSSWEMVEMWARGFTYREIATRQKHNSRQVVAQLLGRVLSRLREGLKAVW